jgi:hypothetical protein
VKPKELKQMNEVKRAVEEVAHSLALLSSDMKTLEPQDLMMNARRLASLLPLLGEAVSITKAGTFKDFQEQQDKFYGFFVKDGKRFVTEGYTQRRTTKREEDLRHALYQERWAKIKTVSA